MKLEKKTFHHSLHGIVQQLRICTNLTLRRHIKAESTKASGRVWKHRHFPRIAWTFFPSHIFVRIDVWAWCDNNWCCLPPKWTIFLWIQHKARCWSQRARLPAQQGIRKIMYLVSNQFMWLSNIVEDYESVLKLEFKLISSSSYPWFYCLSKSCTQYFENMAVAAILDKGLRNFKHCCRALCFANSICDTGKRGTREEKKRSRPPGKESSSRLINPNGPTL